ncbi:MAG: NPCBM/NEW2 domain-containing protein [Bacilli bacterium]
MKKHLSLSSFTLGAIAGSVLLTAGMASASTYIRIPFEKLYLRVNGKTMQNVNLLNYDHNLYIPVSTVIHLTGARAFWQKYLPGINLVNIPKVISNKDININGKTISSHPLTFNGVPYVPASTVSTITHLPYGWNAKTNALTISTNPKAIPLTSILSPYSSKGFNSNGENSWPLINKQIRMGGQSYSYGIQFNAGPIGYPTNQSNEDVYFNLNGQFSTLSGLVGIDDKSTTVSGLSLQILGDGKTLFSTALTSGNLPKTFSVSVSGIRELQFRVLYTGIDGNTTSGSNSPNELVDFANMTVS